VVFERNSNSSMDAAAKTLIKNTELKHDKASRQPVIDIFKVAQKLVVRGEGANHKIGPAPKSFSATSAEVDIGLASSIGETIDDPAGTDLRMGTLNYEIWERNSYRQKLYHRIYGEVAPKLPSFIEKDPYSIDKPALNPKTYTESEKVDFEKWFVSKLNNSNEALENTVFETISENIEINTWLSGYADLAKMAKTYSAALKSFKAIIIELERKESTLKVINDQIAELEST